MFKKLLKIFLIIFLFILYTNLCFAKKHYKVYPVLLVHGLTDNFENCFEKRGTVNFLDSYYDCYNDRNNGINPFPGVLNLDHNVFGISYKTLWTNNIKCF